MDLSTVEQLELPAAFDAHVHLRDGDMARLVVPTVRMGGVNQVYVMPNLVPPITTVEQCLAYRARLQAIEPNVVFLMSLYLHESMTVETIREAKKAGIVGVKSYPAGVTTNSSSGVLSYEPFYPIFAEMAAQNMVLNLHGEVPSTPTTTTTNNTSSSSSPAITILNAEPAFLPTLRTLHNLFPTLRIILEHCTTVTALTTVLSLGPTVAATLTPHHLSLTVDDWAADPFSYCKPVAKTPEDRDALLAAVLGPHNDGRIFLGTDSAPHPVQSKRGGEEGKAGVAAGVFTQPYAVGFVLDALGRGVERGVVRREDVTVERLEGFLGGWGRRFYEVREGRGERIVLRRGGAKVVERVRGEGVAVEVVPFRRGETTWSVEWK